ncbi:hypothetical protein LTSEURB_3524, partial [Salmonella enterica subsp. enterica serovar Urbana str. R8-2977]
MQHVGDLRMGYSRFQAAGNGFQNPYAPGDFLAY